MYKKRDARARLLFCSIKRTCIAVLMFLLPLPSSLLKLPNDNDDDNDDDDVYEDKDFETTVKSQ